jgi:hypothetical protein
MTDYDFKTKELEFVRSITAPLYWVFRDSVRSGDQMKNGSLFFVDTGESLFAVTAAHVVDACLKDSECPVFQSMIGGNGHGRTIYLQRKDEKGSSISRLSDRIIGIHHGMDIATLRVSREEVELAGCAVLTSIEGPWPPRLVEVGAVAYCGCPGEARQRSSHHETIFGFVAMGGVATNVHENCISVQIEREKLMSIFGDGLPENYDFRGMSGGPVLEVLQTENGQFWRRPAGVIFQGPNTNDDVGESIRGFEIIRARPVHFINANGTLDIARWDQSNPR